MADDLPSSPVTLQERQCVCGSQIFMVKQVSMHIAGFCSSCNTKLPGWIPRWELGLAPKRIVRDGIDPQTRSNVLAHYLHRCGWCGVHAIEEELYMGHIVPDNKMREFGFARLSNHPANLAPTCRACNAGAHLVTLPDLTMILAAAVAWQADSWGRHAHERSGEIDNDPRAVRSALREDGLAGLPLRGERQTPDNGARVTGRDDGWGDDPAIVA